MIEVGEYQRVKEELESKTEQIKFLEKEIKKQRIEIDDYECALESMTTERDIALQEKEQAEQELGDAKSMYEV